MFVCQKDNAKEKEVLYNCSTEWSNFRHWKETIV